MVASDVNEVRRDTPAATRWVPSAGRRVAFVLLIFVLAATLRILHYREASRSPLRDDFLHLHDSRYYDQQARRAVAGGGLTDDVFFMAPLYPYALSMVYRCVAIATGELPHGAIAHADRSLGKPTYGVEVDGALYLQCLLGALTCVLIYDLARRMGGSVAGIVAGLGAAVYAPSIYHDGLLMATGLITFVNVAAICAVYHAARRQSSAWWVAGGTLVGLCVVAHGTALALLPGVLVWMLFVLKGRVRRRLSACVLFAGPVCVCVVLVAIRNYMVGRDVVLLTSNGGLTFLIGNQAEATGSFKDIPPQLSELPGSTLAWQLLGFHRKPGQPSPSQVSRVLRDRAFEEIFDHPAAAIRLFWKKLTLFLNKVEVGSNVQFHFCERFSRVLRMPLPDFALLGPIGLTGAVCSLWRWRKYSLLHVWLAAQIAVYTIMFVLGRYRMVAVACLLVFAGIQVAWWIDAVRARRVRAVLLSLGVLAIAFLFVHQDVEGFDRQRAWGGQYHLLAIRAAERGENDKAIEYCREALQHDLAPDIEPFGRMKCLTTLAELCIEEGQWDSAREAAQEILDKLAGVPDSRLVEYQRNTARRVLRQARLRIGSKGGWLDKAASPPDG